MITDTEKIHDRKGVKHCKICRRDTNHDECDHLFMKLVADKSREGIK